MGRWAPISVPSARKSGRTSRLLHQSAGLLRLFPFRARGSEPAGFGLTASTSAASTSAASTLAAGYHVCRIRFCRIQASRLPASSASAIGLRVERQDEQRCPRRAPPPHGSSAGTTMVCRPGLLDLATGPWITPPQEGESRRWSPALHHSAQTSSPRASTIFAVTRAAAAAHGAGLRSRGSPLAYRRRWPPATSPPVPDHDIASSWSRLLTASMTPRFCPGHRPQRIVRRRGMDGLCPLRTKQQVTSGETAGGGRMASCLARLIAMMLPDRTFSTRSAWTSSPGRSGVASTR